MTSINVSLYLLWEAGIMTHIIVFLLYFTTDWCSSRWASACAEGRATHAGCWMLVYHTLHAVAVLCIVNDPWCIIALALGGFCGTWLAVSLKNRTKGVCNGICRRCKYLNCYGRKET